VGDAEARGRYRIDRPRSKHQAANEAPARDAEHRLRGRHSEVAPERLLQSVPHRVALDSPRLNAEAIAKPNCMTGARREKSAGAAWTPLFVSLWSGQVCRTGRKGGPFRAVPRRMPQ
jgi:hypothetical protein